PRNQMCFYSKSEISMTLFKQHYKTAVTALGLSAILATAWALEPTAQELPVNIHPSKYEVLTYLPNCKGFCPAQLKADDLTINLDYELVDGSVQQIDDVTVFKNSKELSEVYLDRSEYERISAAIVGGVK
ncbi:MULTISPECIES: hypothetical protein, partial [unclassified Acinetobacter]